MNQGPQDLRNGTIGSSPGFLFICHITHAALQRGFQPRTSNRHRLKKKKKKKKKKSPKEGLGKRWGKGQINEIKIFLITPALC